MICLLGINKAKKGEGNEDKSQPTIIASFQNTVLDLLHREAFPTSAGARCVGIDKLKAFAIQSI